MFEGILNKYGLSRDDLTQEERNTWDQMTRAIASRQITVPDMIDYLGAMIYAIEIAITEDQHKSWLHFWTRKETDLFRRARLKNYILLREMLVSPQRAQKELEKALQNVVK